MFTKLKSYENISVFFLQLKGSQLDLTIVRGHVKSVDLKGGPICKYFNVQLRSNGLYTGSAERCKCYSFVAAVPPQNSYFCRNTECVTRVASHIDVYALLLQQITSAVAALIEFSVGRDRDQQWRWSNRITGMATLETSLIMSDLRKETSQNLVSLSYN